MLDKGGKIFDATENEKRRGIHKKNINDELFLEKINSNLIDLEKKIRKKVEQDTNYLPSIFIFGLPRSGTTLLYQLISYCLDVNYINNLAAKFWSAPLVGLKLSSIVLNQKNRKTNFNSSIGQTEFINEPHEFGYFWAEIFGYTENNVKVGSDKEDIDWERVKKSIRLISKSSQNTFVFKNLIYAFHLNKFSKIFSDSLYIYIKRDLVDTASSMLKTRVRRYGDKDTWWSVRPPEYESLKDLSYTDQIAGQMYSTRNIFDREVAKCDNLNILYIDYESLCEDPKIILESIIKKYSTKNTLKLINDPPREFKRSTYNKDTLEDYRQLEISIDKYFEDNG